MKHLYFTVTNDLSFDRRMRRICHTLATNGYRVTLVGRQLKNSRPLANEAFQQIRIRCFFSKGFLFYGEYNMRLLAFLWRKKMDAVCAIDLDTILPCLAISVLKKITRIYDAHELFTEMKEVRSRPFVHRFWLAVERFAVPKFRLGYTVGNALAGEFKIRYGVQYGVIRNMPLLQPQPEDATPRTYLLYQGAVNEARGFEYLIPAMKELPYKLVICGDGNFMPQLKLLINKYGVTDKIILKGMLPPHELQQYNRRAILGINLVEKEGLNQYLSLANKFFDYIHAGLPQITMNYPEYSYLNKQYNVAVLINDLNVSTITSAVQSLVNNRQLHAALRFNCNKAKLELNWQAEEKKLLSFYKQIFE